MTRHLFTTRTGKALVAVGLLPALVLPPAAAAGLPAAGAVSAADGEPAAPQPVLTQVPLAGVDEAVLAGAPEPDAHAHESDGLSAQSVEPEQHAHGSDGLSAQSVEPEQHAHGSDELSAQSVEPQTRTALAASVDIADPANLVAVTADDAFAAGTVIQIRVKEAQHGWSEWTQLHADPEHGPDPGSVEARTARVGSDPLLAVDATKAEIRVDTPTGDLPPGTALTLVDAPAAAADRDIEAQAASSGQVSGQSLSAQSLSAAAIPGRPPIITRAQWGADESWRNRDPYYTDNIQAGFIHHTASTLNYDRDQAAAQVRAIYSYHTRSLGHSDIDYNFLVDRFGRLYEGRYGGMDRPVLGGHTAGFNEHTFAAVALGNFESSTVWPSQMAAIKDSLARLFAWKLGLSGVSPASTVKLVSAGFVRPTRYPKGSVATLTATSTHQTVNYTSCPGKFLQAEVADIIELGARYSPVVVTRPIPSASEFMAGSRSSVSFSSSSTRAVSWTAEVFSPCSGNPLRTYTGTTSGDEAIDFTWNLRDDAGRRVHPATYTIRVSGTDSNGSAVAKVASTVTITPKPGGPWGPCRNVSRISGGAAFEASVLWGQVEAPDSRTVVLTRGASQSANALAAGMTAAPLAKSLGAPLLLTAADSLSSFVAADIRARAATKVIIVGGDKVIDPKVEAAVAALGVPVTRLTGGSKVRTAAVVADAMGTTSAVVVSPDMTPAHSLAGAALAAARGVPVLFGTSGPLPARTVRALSGRTSVTVAAPASVLGDDDIAAAVGTARWKRLTGTDAVGASLAVAAGFPASPEAITIVPVEADYWSRAPLAAAAGVPLLYTPSSALAGRVVDHLEQRPGIRAASTPIMPAWLDEEVLGKLSKTLRRAATTQATPEPTSTYRLGRTNASPEPIQRGALLNVQARVKTLYTDGVWRKAPKGMLFKVQHKKRDTRHHKAVATGYSTRGWATLQVPAQTTGTWRIKIGDRLGRRDFVRVTE